MKQRALDVAIALASVGAAGLGARWFRRFLADFGGSRAGVDIARGRVSPWADDDRVRPDRDAEAERSAR